MISLYTIFTGMFVITFYLPLSARPARRPCASTKSSAIGRVCGVMVKKGKYEGIARSSELTVSHLSMRVDDAVRLIRSEIGLVWLLNALTHGVTVTAVTDSQARTLGGGRRELWICVGEESEFSVVLGEMEIIFIFSANDCLENGHAY